MITTNQNTISERDEAIYVYFDHKGIKVSELLIPTETKTLSDLITENSLKYKIPTEVFFDMVQKNKINLSENNSQKITEHNNQNKNLDDYSDKNDRINSFSTRSNLTKTYKSNYTNVINTPENLGHQNRKKEMIYKEILSYEDSEIPKEKLIELTSNLLGKSHKNMNEDKKLENLLMSTDRISKILNDDKEKNYFGIINNNNQSKIEENDKRKNSFNNKLINMKLKNLCEIESLKDYKKTNKNNQNVKNLKIKIDSSNMPINLKSPRNIKINLDLVSRKSDRKAPSVNKKNVIKNNSKKVLDEKNSKSPNYNFLNINNLLIKNYKNVDSYAEKEAYAKQIKGNINQERLNNNKDFQTYMVYNYEKNLPQHFNEKKATNLNLSKNILMEENLMNKLNTNQINQNDNNDEYNFIGNLDNKLFTNSKTEENSKQLNDEDSKNVNLYNDLKNIITPIKINEFHTSNKISDSNSQYISLKSKLEKLSCDYILNFNNKENSNILNAKDMIDQLIDLNFSGKIPQMGNENFSNDKNNNNIINQNLIINKDKNNKINNKINFENNIEEKFLASENMTEKSSFLLNNFNNNPSNNDKENIIKNKSDLQSNNNLYNFDSYTNFNLNNYNKDKNNLSNSNFKSLNIPNHIKRKNQKNKLSNSLSKIEKNISYGERLFYKGLIYEEKKEKKTEVYKKLKEAEFEKNCTFKPKLNHNSIAINVKSNYSKMRNSSLGPVASLKNNFSTPNLFYNNNYNYSTHLNNNAEYLSNYDISKNLSCENDNNNNNNFIIKNNLNDRYKNKQCNHNPLNNTVNFNEVDKDNFSRVNSNFNSKLLNKTSFKSPEEIELLSKRLYDNAEKYKNKKLSLQESYYAQTCPFTPEIISRDEGEIPSMQNFFNRLQTWVDKRNEKYEQDLEKNHYDEKTGNRLFSPQINKQKRNNESLLNESNKFERYQELYENHKNKLNKIAEINEKNAQEISVIANIAHINEKSKDIVGEIQTKIFVHLFELLSDKTLNLIDGKEVDMSEIPEKIQSILMPLLNELKEQNETLTLDEFIMASKHLYDSLPVHFKQSLMEWYLSFSKNKKNPELCEKSRTIAEKQKLFCANMLLKSIDEIKLKNDNHNRTGIHLNTKLNNNLNTANNNSRKQSIDPILRSHLIRNYYEQNERINETLAENNSEN